LSRQAGLTQIKKSPLKVLDQLLGFTFMPLEQIASGMKQLKVFGAVVSTKNPRHYVVNVMGSGIKVR